MAEPHSDMPLGSPVDPQPHPSSQPSHLIAALSSPSVSSGQMQQHPPNDGGYGQMGSGGPMRVQQQGQQQMQQVRQQLNPYPQNQGGMVNRPGPGVQYHGPPSSQSGSQGGIGQMQMGPPMQQMGGPPPQMQNVPPGQQGQPIRVVAGPPGSGQGQGQLVQVRAPPQIMPGPPPNQQNQSLPVSRAALSSVFTPTVSSSSSSTQPPLSQPQQIQVSQHQMPMVSQAMSMPAMGTPAGPVQQLPTSGCLMDKSKLDDLVKQLDPSVILEDNVKDVLLEIADEFVEEIISKVCVLAQHRGNLRLEVRDVELVLDLVHKMPRVPRSAVHVFGAQGAARTDERLPATLAHQQRLQLLKKSIRKT